MNKNRWIKLISAFFLAGLVLFAAACGGNSDGDGQDDDKSKDKDGTIDADTHPGGIEDEDSDKAEDGEHPNGNGEPDKGDTGINPLTGLACSEDLVGVRPVALMINNIKVALPQTGISKADILYECTVEGAITRLMAVFLDYESLAETGSVRSSRDYFIDIAQAHDAIYAHCGGSPDAYAVFKQRKIDHLDGTNDYLPDTFWKNQERMKTMGYEHSSMTDGEGLVAGIERKKFRTDIAEDFDQPLHFYEQDTQIEGNAALHVSIPFSSYAQSYLDYDPETKQYLKGQFGAKHIDGETGEQLSFKNGIILFARHYTIQGDEYGRIGIDFTGTGTGYYVTDGKYKAIVWKKADRETPYALYEEDGKTALLLNPGKSYIAIVPQTVDITFSNE